MVYNQPIGRSDIRSAQPPETVCAIYYLICDVSSEGKEQPRAYSMTTWETLEKSNGGSYAAGEQGGAMTTGPKAYFTPHCVSLSCVQVA
jgi:hypothetical protein